MTQGIELGMEQPKYIREADYYLVSGFISRAEDLLLGRPDFLAAAVRSWIGNLQSVVLPIDTENYEICFNTSHGLGKHRSLWIQRGIPGENSFQETIYVSISEDHSSSKSLPPRVEYWNSEGVREINNEQAAGAMKRILDRLEAPEAQS